MMKFVISYIGFFLYGAFCSGSKDYTVIGVSAIIITSIVITMFDVDEKLINENKELRNTIEEEIEKARSLSTMLKGARVVHNNIVQKYESGEELLKSRMLVDKLREENTSLKNKAEETFKKQEEEINELYMQIATINGELSEN